MKSTIHALSSVKAPPDTFGERGLHAQTSVTDPTFWDRYDNDTLIYDSIWQTKAGRLRIYCPKLLGFKKTMLRATFRINGQVVGKPKLREFRQFDVMDLPCRTEPQIVEMQVDDTTVPLPFSVADPDRFAGKNVVYTKVQNDNLDWIHDWGVAHQRNHGANAIVIANNASTAYSNEDLRATLAAIPGIDVADVLDGPHSHGPHPSTCKGIGWARFQQKSYLNIMRDRFLMAARAVLLCDVDELVAEPSGHSIFDATVNSWAKYKPFRGAWRFTDAAAKSPHHADHMWQDENESPCPGKYCIVPNSLLGRTSWSVHTLENVNRRLFPPRNAFRYYHCRGISTSWKYDRKGGDSRRLTIDPMTRDFLASTFNN